ncbi:MAG: indole-3-glycerol phosphate synthase TrpC [Desulfobacterales bacterium]|nr:indole-3-glycerol phosphate synthase TrpC [Desulfobacterales bacterium]
MHSALAEILLEKRVEVERVKKRSLPGDRGNDIYPVRNFMGAISSPGKINLIAEIKFASPSAGDIRKKTDPVSIGRVYEKAGAAAVSLITDKRFFKGDQEQLPCLKGAISLPVLRKDFIIDEVQVKESFLYGADALLLIARILSVKKLRALLGMCRELGMTPLTEVHDRLDLNKALDCGAEIIGINNRDLDTFEVDLKTTLELAPLVPKGCITVSESGISSAYDIRLLKKCGVNAVLAGTSLMESDDIRLKTRELVLAGQGSG